MAKKTISLKALLQDLRSGMDDVALMERHELTAEQLKTVFRKAVEKGGITQEELDSLREKTVRPAQEPVEPRKDSGSLDGAKPLQSKPVTQPAQASADLAAVPATQSHHEEPAPEQARRSPIKKIILLAVPSILIAAFVITVKFLPWWVSVALVLAFAGLAWLLVPYLLKKLFMAPFKMKGAALSGAEVIVHGITPSDPPQSDDDDPEEVSKRRSLNWYYLDATITPKDQSGGFTHWEPGELLLVRMDAKPEDLEDEDQEVSQIHDYRIFSDGSFREDDVYKHPGPQRLKFHVGVKPGENELQFRYYFQLFGKVLFHGN